ncbi:FG-GAP repeat domain-containing protein [Yoonia sp. R2331]|uniref:FG-GAP repeat domain-containing protein n=1 Tax=Yoonia sp. R2331 TaxID=3237238 RepID=UPI0034E4CB9D
MWRLAATLLALATPVAADTILSAEFTAPTTRYAHGILGDAVEWGTLRIEVGATVGQEGSLFNGKRSLTYEINLPEDRVFEDLEPRLWDITGDGAPEVVVILSHVDLGAALVVMGLNADNRPVEIAATPHIGRTNRWLAPFAAADLDGDGDIEIAYIDRPHLAKTLRIWRYADGDFREIANIEGLTNHKIGQDFIQGGLRDCGDGPRLITANANWTQIMETTLTKSQITSQPIAPFTGPPSLAAALTCP